MQTDTLTCLVMQGMQPATGAVRLSNRPILGPDAGPAPVATASSAHAEEAPRMLDRVKQLVGLGPASTNEVGFCSLLAHALTPTLAQMQMV